MKGTYFGHLSHGDPLYGYIQGHIAPQLGFISPSAHQPRRENLTTLLHSMAYGASYQVGASLATAVKDRLT